MQTLYYRFERETIKNGNYFSLALSTKPMMLKSSKITIKSPGYQGMLQNLQRIKNENVYTGKYLSIGPFKNQLNMFLFLEDLIHNRPNIQKYLLNINHKEKYQCNISIECCICYTTSTNNVRLHSYDYESGQTHDICIKCAKQLKKNRLFNCPICRFNLC